MIEQGFYIVDIYFHIFRDLTVYIGVSRIFVDTLHGVEVIQHFLIAAGLSGVPSSSFPA